MKRVERKMPHALSHESKNFFYKFASINEYEFTSHLHGRHKTTSDSAQMLCNLTVLKLLFWSVFEWRDNFQWTKGTKGVKKLFPNLFFSLWSNAILNNVLCVVYRSLTCEVVVAVALGQVSETTGLRHLVHDAGRADGVEERRLPRIYKQRPQISHTGSRDIPAEGWTQWIIESSEKNLPTTVDVRKIVQAVLRRKKFCPIWLHWKYLGRRVVRHSGHPIFYVNTHTLCTNNDLTA